MTWTVLVPLKPAGTRKARLGDILDAAARDRLAEAMLARVGAALAGVAGVRPVLVAEAKPAAWTGEWHRDAGGGLNAALEAARAALVPARLAVIHADLPVLGAEDVAALLDAAAEAGCALASDRAGTGTNALALADARPFRFAFGAGSFARHRAAAGAAHAVVGRYGLALDIDTAEDVAALIAPGQPAPAEDWRAIMGRAS